MAKQTSNNAVAQAEQDCSFSATTIAALLFLAAKFPHRQFNSSELCVLSGIGRTAMSQIKNEKKHSDRTGIVDYVESTDDEGDAIDPISAAQDSDLTASEQLVRDELREDQRRCFDETRASFNGDAEMQEYLDALSQRIFKRADISAVTGIPVEKIDELRRKVMKHARRIFGVPDFKALQRRLMEGK